MFARCLLVVCLIAIFVSSVSAKVPILLDTDIGGDIDDALAFALALEHPDIELLGVTTVHGDAFTRAKLVCRWLTARKRLDVPVAAGALRHPIPDFTGQMQYALRPSFQKDVENPLAHEFMYRQIRARPGEITLVAVGPLTNVAELFQQHPDCARQLKRLIVMGGAIHVGYTGKAPAVAEYNIKTDVEAAQAVFRSGAPITVVPLDATATLELDAKARQRIFQTNSVSTNQLHALYQLWQKPTPILFDPVAVALALSERGFTMKEMHLKVDNAGFTRVGKRQPNCRVAIASDGERFVKWYVDQLSSKPSKPAPFKVLNVRTPVERGGFPARVHVCEDYETDIERRWWLAGVLETKEVPSGSKRACRSVLCNDFDGKMGDANAMYQAVIFNPVPGSPMGSATRLAFRCRLTGTDKLRVQIYSLSKGYHRCLTLTELPQGKWLDLTVDMTQARRPDGSGGPLSADERIDDIQFYTERDAELLIDDIVLYEGATEDEKRPFPERVIFTGWFDTGKQGGEWPGDFHIVPHQSPRTWKAAKSVIHPQTKKPYLRLSLRGPRRLVSGSRLFFRYRLDGADSLKVVLYSTVRMREYDTAKAVVTPGQWREKTFDFDEACEIDEIHFALDEKSELQIDDVLLYEPGQ